MLTTDKATSVKEGNTRRATRGDVGRALMAERVVVSTRSPRNTGFERSVTSNSMGTTVNRYREEMGQCRADNDRKLRAQQKGE